MEQMKRIFPLNPFHPLTHSLHPFNKKSRLLKKSRLGKHNQDLFQFAERFDTLRAQRLLHQPATFQYPRFLQVRAEGARSVALGE